jgi:SAM-dependent methyltransferase
MKRFILLGLLAATSAGFAANLEDVFTDVYTQGKWGRPWYSGDGSTVSNAAPYVQFLEQFLKEHDIHSVADVGCGDWQFSRHIDWSGVSYTGYDVTPGIVERNQAFASKSIQFVCADACKTQIAGADLLVCKDVLQHLSYEQVHNFLKNLGNFRYCLITNDINPRQGTTINRDISDGGYRELDLRAPPFNLQAKEVLRFRCHGNLKQVLLIENPTASR